MEIAYIFDKNFSSLSKLQITLLTEISLKNFTFSFLALLSIHALLRFNLNRLYVLHKHLGFSYNLRVFCKEFFHAVLTDILVSSGTWAAGGTTTARCRALRTSSTVTSRRTRPAWICRPISLTSAYVGRRSRRTTCSSPPGCGSASRKCSSWRTTT